MKTFVISVDAASNAVVAKDFLQEDGAGAVKAYASGTSCLGVAATDKNTNNKVGCIREGLMKVPTVNAAYAIGDEVECTSAQKVQAYSAGAIVGKVMESKTTTASDNLLLVHIKCA